LLGALDRLPGGREPVADLARAVDQLVEALRLQEASTRVDHDPVRGRPLLGAPPRRLGSSATCSCSVPPIG